MNTRRLLLLTALALIGGCVALGWRFGPVFSCRNVGLFAAPPIVVQRRSEYFLAWTYGQSAFYYRPSYRALDGRLVFVLQGSSSSGDVRGRYTEMKIEGAEKLHALRGGGAVWWEPDGSYVTLRLVDRSPPKPANIVHQ